MGKWSLSLFLFLCANLWAQSGTEKFLHKTERASQLVDLLDSSDDDIKEAAFKELLAMGKDARPFIEDKLRQKGGGLCLELLKAIYTEGLSPEKADDVKVDLPTKPTEREVDEYVYAKYLEAVAYFDKRDYDKADEIVGALLILEPSSAYKSYLEKIASVCQQKKWQGSLLSATISSDKMFYEAGETPKITFHLENVSDDKITIYSASQKGKGYVLAHIKLTFYDPLGTATTFEQEDEVGIDAELALDVGKKWEKEYAIGIPPDAVGGRFICVCEVAARILPQQITASGKKYFKQIDFDGAVCRIYPAGSKKIVQAGALKMLGKAVDEGTLADVFVCAMLLNETEKEAGIEILMRALASSAPASPAEQMILTSLKQLTGLPYGQDKNAWLAWWGKRNK